LSSTLHRRNRRGHNAIEFALTLPFFLMLVLGLMDYGFLFAMQAGIDNATSMACREGALADSARGQDPTVIAAGHWGMRSPMFCGGMGTCTFTPADLSTGAYAVPNRTLRCQTTRTMQSFTGLLPYPTQITSVSYYRLEWQRVP
jgi:hypothetical protein